MDIYSRRKRSQIMARVASQDTAPELAVRSLIHNMGFRFRLNRKDLSGKPDIVLPRLGKAIFVHGCFWHQHPNCPKARRPQTNSRFWNDKLDANVARDERSLRKLRELGWQTLNRTTQVGEESE